MKILVAILSLLVISINSFALDIKVNSIIKIKNNIRKTEITQIQSAEERNGLYQMVKEDTPESNMLLEGIKDDLTPEGVKLFNKDRIGFFQLNTIGIRGYLVDCNSKLIAPIYSTDKYKKTIIMSKAFEPNFRKAQPQFGEDIVVTLSCKR